MRLLASMAQAKLRAANGEWRPATGWGYTAFRGSRRRAFQPRLAPCLLKACEQTPRRLSGAVLARRCAFPSSRVSACPWAAASVVLHCAALRRARSGCRGGFALRPAQNASPTMLPFAGFISTAHDIIALAHPCRYRPFLGLCYGAWRMLMRRPPGTSTFAWPASSCLSRSLPLPEMAWAPACSGTLPNTERHQHSQIHMIHSIPLLNGPTSAHY